MQNLIISVEEARRILGDSAEKMSDEEVERLIIDLDFFACAAIRGDLEANQRAGIAEIGLKNKSVESFSQQV